MRGRRVRGSRVRGRRVRVRREMGWWKQVGVTWPRVKKNGSP